MMSWVFGLGFNLWGALKVKREPEICIRTRYKVLSGGLGPSSLWWCVTCWTDYWVLSVALPELQIVMFIRLAQQETAVATSSRHHWRRGTRRTTDSYKANKEITTVFIGLWWVTPKGITCSLYCRPFIVSRKLCLTLCLCLTTCLKDPVAARRTPITIYHFSFSQVIRPN